MAARRAITFGECHAMMENCKDEKRKSLWLKLFGVWARHRQRMRPFGCDVEAMHLFMCISGFWKYAHMFHQEEAVDWFGLWMFDTLYTMDDTGMKLLMAIGLEKRFRPYGSIDDFRTALVDGLGLWWASYHNLFDMR